MTLLQGRHPNGYAVQSRSHNAVAASVAQKRSDWGVAIRQVADRNKASAFFQFARRNTTL